MIVSCLVAGAATTLIIAWSAALARPLARERGEPFWLDHSGRAWLGRGDDGLGWRTRTFLQPIRLTDEGRATASNLPNWLAGFADELRDNQALTVIGCGWPLTCLIAWRDGVGHDEPRPGSNTWHSGLGPQWIEWDAWRGAIGAGDDVDAAAADARLLPWHVDAVGLFANTLLFAALWSMPIVGLALRRCMRIRAGRCKSCGYDLRKSDSNACSECGTVH